MIFDITGFLNHISMQVDLYMVKKLNEVTVNNPSWIKELKEDRSLFNEDGTPVKELTKEMTDSKIKEIIMNTEFKTGEEDENTIFSLFTVDESLLRKFMMND